MCYCLGFDWAMTLQPHRWNCWNIARQVHTIRPSCAPVAHLKVRCSVALHETPMIPWDPNSIFSWNISMLCLCGTWPGCWWLWWHWMHGARSDESGAPNFVFDRDLCWGTACRLYCTVWNQALASFYANDTKEALDGWYVSWNGMMTSV